MWQRWWFWTFFCMREGTEVRRSECWVGPRRGGSSSVERRGGMELYDELDVIDGTMAPLPIYLPAWFPREYGLDGDNGEGKDGR